jgi:hypothetical protein
MKYSNFPVKSYWLRFQLAIGVPLGNGYWAPPRRWKSRLCLFLGIEPADRWIRKTTDHHHID